MSMLVTRLIASRGDLDVKNLGVRLGGRVSGLRDPAVPAAFSAHAVPRNEAPPPPPGADPTLELNRSRCSVDTGLVVCRCFGYQPLAGPPANLNISPLANKAWWCCSINRVLPPLPPLLLLRTVLSRMLLLPPGQEAHEVLLLMDP